MTTATSTRDMDFNGAFWDLLDLSLNVERALNAVRGLNRGQSIVMLVVLTIIEYCLGWAVYYFDYLPTYVWATQWAAKILAAASLANPELVVSYAAYLATGLTLLPTLIELIGIRFAISGMKIVGLLVWMFLIFDFVTDWPYVGEFLSVYKPYLAGMGLWAIPAEWAMSILFTLMASIGFEVIFVSFGVAWIYLLFKGVFGFGGGRRGRRTATA